MEVFRFGARLALSVIKRKQISIHRRAIQSTVYYSTDRKGKIEKYKEFKDEESTEILDVYEERQRIAESLLNERSTPQVVDVEHEAEERVPRLSVEELVTLIKNNKGEDLTVLKLPTELKYVDFLLITTGRSQRHIQGLGETIRKYAKDRLDNIRNVPQLEGSDSEWIALDLGNICIHIMSNSLRGAYDLESLWGVGSKYDIKLHQQDERILALLKKHSYSSFGSSKNLVVDDSEDILPSSLATN